MAARDVLRLLSLPHFQGIAEVVQEAMPYLSVKQARALAFNHDLKELASMVEWYRARDTRRPPG